MKKSLYGLKQSGRNWNIVLSQFFISKGFQQSKVDVCLFTLNDGTGVTFVVVWVDDMLMAANSERLLTKWKNTLKDEFQMKDLGRISYFLGIQFKQTKDSITMNQSFYLKNVLARFKMSNCKPRNTPCEANLNAYERNDGSRREEGMNENYREIVGSLVYAMTCTRPDLAWVVTKLSQHLEQPNDIDWMTIKHVLRYIQGTYDKQMIFTKSRNGLTLTGHSDSDWAASRDDRRSTTGYTFSLNQEGPVIVWKSKKQKTVALSSCEAEYMAISHATQELLFIKMLCKDFGIEIETPINVYGDNQGSMDMIRNPSSNERSKHIDIRHHFVREKYSSGLINVTYKDTNENIADLFTKPATRQKLEKFIRMLFGR